MPQSKFSEKLDVPVVLFDGVCLLCSSAVKFILTHNKREDIHFATLQSAFAQNILKHAHLDSADLDTVVFVCNGQVFIKSRAIFQIAGHLTYPFKALKTFRHFPSWFTDRIYDFVAQNRYRWFGRKAQCMIPEPRWKSRFFTD